MNKLRTWLIGLLGLQIILVVIVYLATHSEEAKFESEYLLEINKASVDKIVVSSSDKDVTLEKKGKAWVISSLNDLPADQAKVELSIQDLYDLKTTWPVTTSENAHQRFEVSEDKFTRSVKLSQGEGEDQVVYIGTTPSFRKTHVRSKGDVNVYALEVNAFDFSDKVEDWLDKTLLSVSSVDAISEADISLKKVEDKWNIVSDSGEFKPADSARVNMVTEALAKLSVLGIAEEVPEFSGEDHVTLIIKNNSGEWTYELFKQISSYFIKRQDIDSVFQISRATYKQLAEIKAEDFIGSEPNVEGSGNSKDESAD